MVWRILSRLGVANTLRSSAKSFRMGAASEAYSLVSLLRTSRGWGVGIPTFFMEYILGGARAKRARRIQVKLAGKRSDGCRFVV